MKVTTLEDPLSEGESIEIINVDFDAELLTITVLIDGDKLDVTFDAPVGFRVLDEGDLLEYWPDFLPQMDGCTRLQGKAGWIKNAKGVAF